MAHSERRKRWRPAAGLLILLCAVLQDAGTFAAAAERVYRIGYMLGSVGHIDAVRRLGQVYADADLKVEFMVLPTQRSILWANSGEIDGDAARVPAIEATYTNLVRVNEPINRMRGFAYTNKPDLLEAFSGDPAQLSKLRIARVRGVKWAEQYLSNEKSTTATTNEELFVLLANKRVDVVLATESSADEIIKTVYSSDGIVKLAPILAQTETYHYLHKSNRDIVPLLERSIRKLAKDETNSW